MLLPSATERKRWIGVLVIRPHLLLLTLVIAAVAFAASGGASAPLATDVRIVASVSADAQVADVAASLRAQGFTVEVLDELRAVEVTAARTAGGGALSRVQATAGVRSAEAVTPVGATDTPADPLYSMESGYLTSVNAPLAWEITTGSNAVVVAVIDTGVDVQHPNLRPNIWTNTREIPNNGIDDDGNGCTDDVNGCSFVTDSSPGCTNVSNGFVADDIGHGTFVAGVIGAAANNTGIVGVARNVRIMAVKVLDCRGAGDSVSTALGITYAARNGARVINLSLGGIEDSQLVTDAIQDAISRGVTVIAASGNDSAGRVAFPARVPGVLAVAAASQTNADQRAPFSNWGPEIGVAAVGVDIVGPVPKSRCNFLFQCIAQGPWARGSGTSFSTPQISGLAALVLSLRPDVRPAQVIDLIKNGATALPGGSTPNWAGAGRANMVSTLKAAQGNQPPGDPCVVGSVQDGGSFTCADGRKVKMLQMTAPVLGQCGGDWAKAALQNIFLPPGRTVSLRYDVARTDASGAILAAPLWRGNDGSDYNLSIVMVYVGLAKAADVGAGNALYRDWANASQGWAAAASWNMWAPGKPFAGGC